MSLSLGAYIKLEQHVFTEGTAGMTVSKELVPWQVVNYDGVSSYTVFRNGEYRMIHRDQIIEIMPKGWHPDTPDINQELDTLLNEYALEGPNRERLTQWLRRYPQYERELTQFTVDWTTLQAQEQEREQQGDSQVDEAIVQRGMAVVRGILQEQKILTQAQQAILQERERRDYQVIVGQPRKTTNIAGIPIPAALEAYVATTLCTVQHESGIQCQWADWAFHLGEHFHVVLQNDLFQPGTPLEARIQALFDQMQ